MPEDTAPSSRQAAPQTGWPEGILAIWHDIAAGREAEVFDWYDREHHYERLALPGFLTARRYLRRGAGPLVFTVYQTGAVADLGSDAYAACLNAPSPWTLRCMPHYRNMSRTLCCRLARFGGAEGGYVFALRLPGLDGWDWQAAAEVTEAAGVLALDVWQANDPAPGQDSGPSREAALRGGADARIGAALVLHASSPEAAAAGGAALRALLPAALAEAAQGSCHDLAFAAGTAP